MKIFYEYLKLIRWPNLLFIAVTLWLMEKKVALPILLQNQYQELLPAYLFILIILAVVFIAAGGYAVNDYFDVKIDAINHPDHQVVNNTISKQQAMRVYQICTAAGVACGVAVAIILRSLTLGIVFVFVPGLMWFYSSSYKRQFLVGNIIVALSTGITPFVIALANVAALTRQFASYLSAEDAQLMLRYTAVPHDLYMWLGMFSLFAFMGTWIREIEKDLQDQMGDRELECHTMPIKIGETWTKIIVTLLILITCGMVSLLNMPVRYLVFGILVPFACNLWLLWSAKIASDYRSVQILTKFIIFLGLCISFLVPSLLAAENFLRV